MLLRAVHSIGVTFRIAARNQRHSVSEPLGWP